jgi:hypothetical protein
MAEPDLAEDWKTLGHPREDNGCVICGVGGTDVLVGDTRPEDVTWRCEGCMGLVCRDHTLCIPDARRGVPLYKGREYFSGTYCSITCWERCGSPDE